MNRLSPICFRLALLGAAGTMLGQSLAVANVLNGGFDETSTAPNQLNHWSSVAVPPGDGPGDARGGVEGGYGWDSSYFTGGFPTNDTFATTISGPIRQDLTGGRGTFVEGVTYTLTVDLFSSDTYGPSVNANIMWTLCLTADGVPVARDHWFSDEFLNSSVGAGNGGTIPDNRIINVIPGSPGLTTATLTYTATAEDEGKTIGVRLGDPSQSLYTLADGAPVPSPYYGMMDNLLLLNDTFATLRDFTPETTIVDGFPITLSWEVIGLAKASALTLDAGSGPVDVLALTDTTTGIGSTTVNPTADTTYTLTLDDAVSLQINLAASIISFSSDISVIDGLPINLNWEIRNPLLLSTITLDDGNGPVDVLADTDTSIGFGSTSVNPTESTTYTLTLNGGATRTLDIYAGEVISFTSSAVVAKLPSNELTLSWEVFPPDADVIIRDGTNEIDVSADTDKTTGIGSRMVAVLFPSTTFEISVSGSPNVRRVRVFRETTNSDALALDQTSITTSGSLTVSWNGAAAGPTDWIGIYRIGDTPGPVGSTQWNYLNGTRTSGPAPSSGTMTFTGLGVGDYFAVLLLNDGYTLAEGPILFSVTEPPPPAADTIRVVSVSRSGDEITVVWESKAGFEYDIFASDKLEGDPYDDWEQLQFAWPSEGDATTGYTEDLSLLPGGVPLRRFYKIFEYEVLP